MSACVGQPADRCGCREHCLYVPGRRGWARSEFLQQPVFYGSWKAAVADRVGELGEVVGLGRVGAVIAFPALAPVAH